MRKVTQHFLVWYPSYLGAGFILLAACVVHFTGNESLDPVVGLRALILYLTLSNISLWGVALLLLARWLGRRPLLLWKRGLALLAYFLFVQICAHPALGGLGGEGLEVLVIKVVEFVLFFTVSTVLVAVFLLIGKIRRNARGARAPVGFMRQTLVWNAGFMCVVFAFEVAMGWRGTRRLRSEIRGADHVIVKRHNHYGPEADRNWVHEMRSPDEADAFAACFTLSPRSIWGSMLCISSCSGWSGELRREGRRPLYFSMTDVNRLSAEWLPGEQTLPTLSNLRLLRWFLEYDAFTSHSEP